MHAEGRLVRDIHSKKIFSWVLVAAVAALIFFLSSRTDTQLNHETGIFSLIKSALAEALSRLCGHAVDPSPIGHFIAYFVLGASLANALSFDLAPLKAWAASSIAASFYGASDEFHQIFVAGRTCDILDWTTDTVAAVLGASLVCGCIVFIFRSSHGRRQA